MTNERTERICKFRDDDYARKYLKLTLETIDDEAEDLDSELDELAEIVGDIQKARLLNRLLKTRMAHGRVRIDTDDDE